MRKWRFGWLSPDLHCIPRGNSRLNQLRNVGPLGYLNPRVEGHQSILASASCRGLGIGVGCGLVFGFPLLRWFRVILSLVRFSWFWTFRLAAVSVYLIVGSRSVLVSDVPIGGGFVSIMLIRSCWVPKKHWYIKFLPYRLGGGYQYKNSSGQNCTLPPIRDLLT